MARPFRQLLLIVVLLSSVLALGTFGYRFIEDRSYFDSFFMALISLTTVGYGEQWDLSHNGRVFTSVLLIVGVTVVFASIGIMSDLVVRLELGNYFGKKRLARMLHRMKDHYIVCGVGRVGRAVVGELVANGVPVVVIDEDAERATWASNQKIPTVVADASLDQTLAEAGIDRAAGLVVSTGSDIQNVYVTLTARGLNPGLRIAARAADEQAEDKLSRAGATSVFTPYSFIGHRLAQSVLRPQVVRLLDVGSAFQGSGRDLRVEQIQVCPNCELASAPLSKKKLEERLGVIVLAVTNSAGELLFNPPEAARIDAGDFLIAMGEQSKLDVLERELGNPKST